MNETPLYKPFSERALKKLRNVTEQALIHELGHYVVMKLLIPNGRFSIRLNVALEEKEIVIDGESGTSIKVSMLENPKVKVTTASKPNLSLEEELLINAAGYATEELLGITEPHTIEHLSETDTQDFSDRQEFLNAVASAKQKIEPHIENIGRTATKLAGLISQAGGGKFIFEETDFNMGI